MKTYGLVGKNISYSFSRNYFNEKFSAEKISAIYRNFDLQDLDELPLVLKGNPELAGLNVTIPYKEKVLHLLDEIDSEAQEIGAVNTIKFVEEGRLKGYNTDHYGFTESIKPFLKDHHNAALILGTGGASKAIAFALQKMGISYTYVSRSPKENDLQYEDLDKVILSNNQLIINCTPVGTFPESNAYPPVPAEHFTKEHLVYDLIYNPEETQLMKLARQQNATAVNGLQMLELQAERAWEIWNM